MENVIKIRIKTLSNLFIGGSPMPFEIGGIDQWTAVDGQGFPCIPASSLKGALRAIVMEDHSKEADEIARWYAELLRKEKEENEALIQKYYKENTEALVRTKERYASAIKEASAGHLFGIREFNNTPKLLFNDLLLKKEHRDLPKSNPRTYKTARMGLEFEGEIELYRFNSKYFDNNAIEKCKAYIVYNLKKFNGGVYRLGNSKSRGYGKVYVSIE